MRLQRIVSCTFLAFPDTALSDTIIDTSPPERMVHICMMPVRCPPGHRVDNYGRRGLGISDRVTLWGSVPVVFVLSGDKARLPRRE